MLNLTVRLLAGAMLAFGAQAQVPDYFPLETGNQWIYRSTSGRIGGFLTIEVGERRTVEGRDYFVVTGLVPNLQGETILIRGTEDGKLVRYSEGGKELLLADFGAADGTTFSSYMLTQCPALATLKSHNAHYEGPVGSFDNAVALAYGQGPCADAGNQQEYFLPWVGMVRRIAQSIAGPITYDLIFSRTGGVTELTGPNLSFQLSLDRAIYRQTDSGLPAMAARLNLRNTTADPVKLTFPSGQDFDFVIRDGNGTEVYVWSTDKIFTMVIRNLSFRGEKNWAIEIPSNRLDLKPGRYTAEAWLTTSDPRPRFLARVGFEVE